MSTSNPDRPERMYRAGRPVDPDFSPEENLYFRSKEIPTVDERVIPTGIRFPDFSVNRSKYSEPEDVLIPSYGEYGILTFKVKDIPAPETTNKTTLYEWKAVHEPTDDNYSHSEVQTFKNGEYKKKLDIPTTLKKQFRMILSERMSVIPEQKKGNSEDDTTSN
ncbi:hypothetical protein [Argonema galeatum]|uniref:hypothetical protein n=1 Tax=Argonema galeatum TaxID=2942762 RepID=UPI002012642F|nr:hypothetical protein [Argonema galeatum]MCL1468906.1 hypothetical protein [Argonema galeatum A003/A1]